MRYDQFDGGILDSISCVTLLFIFILQYVQFISKEEKKIIVVIFGFTSILHTGMCLMIGRSVRENICPRSFTVQTEGSESKYFSGQTKQTRLLRYLLHGFSFRSVKENAACSC